MEYLELNPHEQSRKHQKNVVLAIKREVTIKRRINIRWADGYQICWSISKEAE